MPLDELVREGMEIYPKIKNKELSDPEVVRWVRNVQREMKFMDPGWSSGSFKGNVYFPLKCYYKAIVGTVAERALSQYSSEEHFSLEPALEGFDLTGKETTILGELAKRVYNMNEIEAKEWKEFVEKTNPYRKASAVVIFGISVVCGFLGYSILGGAEGFAAGAVSELLIAGGLELKYRFYSASFAKVRPRKKGEALDIAGLKSYAVKELLNPYR